jgi:hypothetical protein
MPAPLQQSAGGHQSFGGDAMRIKKALARKIFRHAIAAVRVPIGGISRHSR